MTENSTFFHNVSFIEAGFLLFLRIIASLFNLLSPKLLAATASCASGPRSLALIRVQFFETVILIEIVIFVP